MDIEIVVRKTDAGELYNVTAFLIDEKTRAREKILIAEAGGYRWETINPRVKYGATFRDARLTFSGFIKKPKELDDANLESAAIKRRMDVIVNQMAYADTVNELQERVFAVEKRVRGLQDRMVSVEKRVQDISGIRNRVKILEKKVDQPPVSVGAWMAQCSQCGFIHRINDRVFQEWSGIELDMCNCGAALSKKVFYWHPGAIVKDG